MLTSKVAKRYAQGLIDFAKESNQVDMLFDEMKTIIKLLNNSKEINYFLATPFIDSKKKITIAKEIFKSLSAVSQNFVSLVIRQGRENQLKSIAQEYINKVEDLKGILRVSLSTASSISENNISKILQNSGLINQNSPYELTVIHNPELIGGYILRVGDHQIDASVKNKLNKIRKDFQIQ